MIITTRVTVEEVDIVMTPETDHIMPAVDIVITAGEDATIIAKGKKQRRIKFHSLNQYL
jgi:hypothetical protein